MTTETIETQEVHQAIVVADPSNTPIKFDITTAAIEQMKQQAAGLSIAGPDDKDGFKAVYEFRQIVKRQRVAVEKKAKELKAPHLQYNRDVDAAVRELSEPMKTIEDGLERQEASYQYQREKIAREAMLVQQQRTEGRVNLLRGLQFEWNPASESYDFLIAGEGVVMQINFDDIKELSNEDFTPTFEKACLIHDEEVERQREVKWQADLEAARIAEEQRAESERLAAEKERLAEQSASLQRQADALDALTLRNRVTALLAVGYTEKDRLYHSPSGNSFVRPKSLLLLTDDQFSFLLDETVSGNQKREQERIEAEAAEAERIRSEKKAELDRKKADKERTKLVKPDAKNLRDFLLTVKVQCKNLPAPLNLPESQDIYDTFFSRFGELVSDSLKQVDAL